ncbi:MAG: hypothetical protein ACOCRO_06745 [Halanaerobiales bacterium]
MKIKIIQKALIQKDLSLIHNSLSKDFTDAIDDDKVLFAKNFLGMAQLQFI